MKNERLRIEMIQQDKELANQAMNMVRKNEFLIRIKYTWQWENFASYARKFGDHSISIMAGMSSQDYKHRATGLYASPMAIGQENYSEFDYVTSETADNVSGYTSEDRLLGYFGRLSYSFKERYSDTRQYPSGWCKPFEIAKNWTLGCIPIIFCRMDCFE